MNSVRTWYWVASVGCVTALAACRPAGYNPVYADVQSEAALVSEAGAEAGDAAPPADVVTTDAVVAESAVDAEPEAAVVAEAGAESGVETSVGPEAGSEAGPDASPDVVSAQEAGPDAGPDVTSGPEAGPDAVVVAEAGADAFADVREAGPDAQAEAGPEAGPDAALEAGPEAGPEAGADAGSDAPVPTVAWGNACSADTQCIAPSGERAWCALGVGTPYCYHSCDAQQPYTLCEGGRGVCIPSDDGQLCVPKCGDREAAVCGPGSACAHVGYHRATIADGGASYFAIGACLASCTNTGVDACLAAGRTCNPISRACRAADCGGRCRAGTTCVGGTCVPPSPQSLYSSCIPDGTPVCQDDLCIGTSTGGFCTIPCDPVLPNDCGAGVCYTHGALGVAGNSTDLTVLAPPSFLRYGGRATGTCLPPCSTEADCLPGFRCANWEGRRTCLPNAIPQATVSAGAPAASICRSNGDCASGQCTVLATGYRDGTCAPVGGASCPAGTTQYGGTLADGGTSPITCVPTCSAASTCPGSLLCDSTTFRCYSGVCRTTQDCAIGYVCDPMSSRCVTSPSTRGGAIGEACAQDADCRSGACLAANAGGRTWTGRYCTANCTVLNDQSDTCPAGAICNASMGDIGICFDLCDAVPGNTRFGVCRSGYQCLPFSGTPSYGFCYPL